MRLFFVAITQNLVSATGAVITTMAAILILSLFGIQASGFTGGPYLGILTFVLLPAVFVGGLLLIPIGRWWDSRRRRRAPGQEGSVSFLPVVDLNVERTRRAVFVFFALTTVNLVIVAVASFNAVHVMDSTEFCGQTCHTVMAPEFATYSRSPHSRVPCVECHIGSGVSWFVKSKLSGTWQLLSVTFDLYQRPIPTPVHNIRPARDTCEQCHWPTKYVGDRLSVSTHYAEDEANTEKKTVILLKVGGIQGRQSKGIHWHVDPGITIEYVSDEKREKIGTVVLTRQDGSVTTFKFEDPELELEPGTRTMDCMDCHNRPTHIYHMPDQALDLAILGQRIDRSLPFIKREGTSALKAEYASHEEAEAEIGRKIREFYATNYPELANAEARRIQEAVDGLVDIYTTNVFPWMNIAWGTYPNHLGHQTSSGCFRCHDGKHKADDGTAISQGCSTCHTLLAMGQENPEILTRLNP